jgi:GT2 family glycosyltransferase
VSLSAEAADQRGEARTSILVVTADPAGDGDDDRSIRALVGSLQAIATHNDIAVYLTDCARRPWWAPGSLRVDYGLGDAGLDPGDSPLVGLADRGWQGWSHVIVTPSGDLSRARRWLDAAQPQAGRVAFFPSLGFRAVADSASSSLQLVRMAALQQASELAGWADALWCEHQGDLEWLRSLFPAKRCSLIPPAIRRSAAPTTFAEREGVVVVASCGHDANSGDEDAALRCLRSILPQLRWRHRDLGCRLVSGWPTPELESAAREAGAEVVGVAQAEEAIARARLLLATHPSGCGQRSVILQSVALGTPFVATAAALGGVEIGDLCGQLIREADADVVQAALELLGGEARWQSISESLGELAQRRYSQRRRFSALRSALAQLGVSALPPWESPAEVALAEIPAPRPYRPPMVPLRPGPHRASTPQPAGDAEKPASDDERYRLWAATRGPTPEVLAAIRADLERLRYRPTISVLMPVHNTDPLLLHEAIQSVRNQLYGWWELCIANDGSTRAATLRVLDEVRRAGENIKFVDLPDTSGISGATNAALSLATGEYVAFLDHDDLLKPHALAQVARWLDADPSLDLVYSDEDKMDTEGRLCEAHLKPDWSPDQLLSQNYVCHLMVVRRSLLEKLGGLRSEFDGSQDHDLALRVTEITDRIAHIPEPLYTWRKVPGSAAADDSKQFAWAAGLRAVEDALVRRYGAGSAETTGVTGIYRPRLPVPGRPWVSIIVATHNGLELLRRCLKSVTERSTYPRLDVVVVDNLSTDPDLLSYLASGPWQVLRYPHRFHFSRMMNFAARSVRCHALLFLNNDTEVITPDWIEAMLEHAMRPEVGAVGARLYFASGQPQHEGIVIGSLPLWPANVNHQGWWRRGDMVRNTSAVTAACCMIRPSLYWRVGGMDERLRIAYNDVDLCQRIRQAGYEIVYTPYAELYHHEGSSRRGFQHREDALRYRQRWEPRPDPYYSPLLSSTQPFVLDID